MLQSKFQISAFFIQKITKNLRKLFVMSTFGINFERL